MIDLLEGLTPAQREAVQHVEGPLLVLAGPGSGKTRVITHRIAYLLAQGVRAHEILALTFTNKAAEEMQGRLGQLAPQQSVWVGTFHRFCARLLRKYAPLVGLQPNYTIYDADDSARTLRRVMSRLRADPAHFTPEAISAAISWAKNRLIGPEQYEPRPGHPLGAVVKRLYPAYQAHLACANAADFDDLLVYAVNLLRDNPELRSHLDQQYRFILVDEYQDTNLAQYALARALSIDYPNLAVTGDPDQSIYGWRGANLSNILEFERDYPNVHVVRLEQNYRSTKCILRVAAELISHNVRRKQKALFTENGPGVPVRLVAYATQKDEAEDIAARIAGQVRAGRRRPRDFAIFYRVNALSRAFEFALRERGVPYQLVNGVEFFQRQEVKDLLAYLRLINNPRDDVALLRIINAPPRGIGKATLQRISEHAGRRAVPLWEALRDCRRIGSLKPAALARLEQFLQTLDRLAAAAAAPVEEILGHVLAESGYKRQFEGSDDEQDQQRLANIEELLTVARQFDDRNPGHHALEQFLEEASLTGETDDWQCESDRVTLMTLHAAKGLEFPVVFLVAAEAGLLPHERRRDDPEGIEEERRLMFVGITRAKQELQISLARYRDFRGQRKLTIPSPFLMELPREEMEVIEQEAPSEAYGPEPTASDGLEEGEPGPPGALRPAPRRPAGIRPLMTGAELANKGQGPPVSPEAFCHGMVVIHPENGLGRIVALGGSGQRRTATVEFHSPRRRVKFVLANSPLRPLSAGLT
ncbi:MAG: ATP-dependent helicase [Thermoguttaceae bacterium]